MDKLVSSLEEAISIVLSSRKFNQMALHLRCNYEEFCCFFTLVFFFGARGSVFGEILLAVKD